MTRALRSLTLLLALACASTLFARDWFVDNAAATGGDGSSTSPLQSLRAAQEASAPGDAILLRPGKSVYAEGFVLKESQSLVASDGRPLIANADGDGIVLAPRTTIAGLTIRAAAHAAIRGTAVGAVAIRDVRIETSNAADGLVLLETAAAVTVEGGGVEGTGEGIGVSIDGGAGAIAFRDFAITQKNGAAAAIRNVSGSVAMQGTITITAGKRDALTLVANRGRVAFGGPLRLTTEGASALVVRDCASVAIAEAELTTVRAQGVLVEGSGIEIDARSISVDGARAAVDRGIALTKTTGRLVVAGGTIRNIRHRGVMLSGASSVTMRNMTFEKASTENGAGCGRPIAALEFLQCNAAIYVHDSDDVTIDHARITGSAQHGIHGDEVRNFALLNSEIGGAGDEIDEAGVLLRNATGQIRFIDTRIHESAARQIELTNDTAEATVTLEQVTLGGGKPPVGQQGMLVTAGGAASVKIAVADSTIANNFSSALHVIAAGNSKVDVSVAGTRFRDNGSAIVLAPSDAATLLYRIENNTISGNTTSALTINSTSSAATIGALVRNVIGIAGKAASGASCGGGCAGIALSSNGRGTSSAVLSNNTLQQVDAGIRVRSGGSSELRVDLIGNTVREPAVANAAPAILLQAGTRPNDVARLCAAVGGDGASANVIAGSWNGGGAAIEIVQPFPRASLSIAGYAGDRKSNANASTYAAGRNRGAGVAVKLAGELTLADHCAIPSER
jgi:hypothetical protein